jgi:hypothetical protein
MQVNKKLGRFKQWAGEKMGGEAKTAASEDLKVLEAEMDLRYTGMAPRSFFEISSRTFPLSIGDRVIAQLRQNL